MYCSSCGAAVSQGLSFCKHCGAKLGGAPGEDDGKSSEVRPELLVSAMAGLFILGLVAIAALIGVMKVIAGLDLPFIVVALALSFMLMLVVEGVFMWLLLSGRRRARKKSQAEPRERQTARELGEAGARSLAEPVPSVTEHTTRTFAPVYGERKPE